MVRLSFLSEIRAFSTKVDIIDEEGREGKEKRLRKLQKFEAESLVISTRRKYFFFVVSLLFFRYF